MPKKIITNKSFEEYSKKYPKHKRNLLKFTDKEVEVFDKKYSQFEYKNKTYSLGDKLLLDDHKWIHDKDNYYEIPKTLSSSWISNLSTPKKAISLTAILALIGGGIALGITLTPHNNFNFDEDCRKVDEINKTIVKTDIKTTNDFVNKYVDISKLEKKNEDDEFAFDVKNKQVVIVSKNSNDVVYSTSKVDKKADVFRFAKEYTFATNPDNNTYSTYLTDEYSGSEISFNSGLDVGNHKEMSLKYVKTAKNKVTANEEYVPMVVTNYGTLLINGPLNSVSHYGILESLTVESLDGVYNEYGTVAGNVILKDGTFKAQENATVNTILIDSNKVKVEVSKDIDYVGTIAATNKDYITSESVVVSKDIPEEKEPVINKEEDIPLPEKGGFDGLGTEASPYTFTDIKIAAPKISEKYDEYHYYMYVGSQKEVDAKSWAYNGKEIKLNGQLDCNGLILNDLDSFFIESLGTVVTEIKPATLSKVSNLTVNANISKAGSATAIARQCGNNVELNNITVHGNIAGAGASAFIGYGASNFDDEVRDMYCTFTNCVSDANLVCTSSPFGSNGAFFIYCYCNLDTGLITVNDSIFNGTMTYPENMHTDFNQYFSNAGQNYFKLKTSYSNEFVTKYGNPEGTLYAAPNDKDSDGTFYCGYHAGSKQYHAKDDYLATDKLKTISYIVKGNINQATSLNDLSTFSTNKVENAKYASASLFIAPNNHNGQGSYLCNFLSEEIDLDNVEVGKEFSTTDVKNYRVRVNKPGVTEQGIHDYEFDIYDGGNFYYVPTGETFEDGEYSTAYVTIVQYDENNLPIYVDHFDLKKPASI